MLMMQDPTQSSQPQRRRASPADTPDVSIVIVNWNTHDLLRECLQSLREQAGAVDCQIIVIDNHSFDGSAAMVQRDFPEVQVIANLANRGFAAANNQGIAIARGRYVLLLNSDTRVLDGAIAKVVAFADTHPRAGLVGCRTYFMDDTIQPNCFLFPSLLNVALSLSRLGLVFRRNRFFGRRRMTWWNYDSVREVEVIAGCFMLARREAICQVGPMAEDYFMYSEDTDWCWRFHKAGWRVMYTPEPVIIHKGRASSSQCDTDMHLLERRALLMFLQRKSGRAASIIANAMFLTSSLWRCARLLPRRLRGKDKDPGTREQWQRSLAAVRFHLFARLPDDLEKRIEQGLRQAAGEAVSEFSTHE